MVSSKYPANSDGAIDMIVVLMCCAKFCVSALQGSGSGWFHCVCLFTFSDVSSSVGVWGGCSTTISAAWESLLISSVPSAHVSMRAGQDSTITWLVLIAPILPKRSR